MSKQLNEWLDGFVENGANPNNVPDWSSNSVIVYDVDVSVFVNPESGLTDQTIQLFADDDRIDVPALMDAIEKNNIIRMKYDMESGESGAILHVMYSSQFIAHASQDNKAQCIVGFNGKDMGTMQEFLMIFALYSINKPIFNFTKGEFDSENNEYELIPPVSLEEIYQTYEKAHTVYIHCDDVSDVEDGVVIRASKTETEIEGEYSYDFVIYNSAYSFNEDKQKFVMTPQE